MIFLAKTIKIIKNQGKSSEIMDFSEFYGQNRWKKYEK